MKRLIAGATVAAVLTVAAAAGASAQPPTSPSPVPPASTQQLTPQNPGGAGNTEQIPVKDPKTGGVRWDQFGGDPADAPQNLDSFIDDVLGWMRTGAGITAVLGVLVSAGLIVIGIRGRSEQAKRAMTTLPVVFGGTVLSASAATILSIFL
jgi:hypothetical protein